MFIGGSFPMPMGGGSINYVYRLIKGIDDLSYFVFTGDDNSEENERFDKSFNHLVIRSRFCYHVLERFKGGRIKKQLYHILAIIQIVFYILKYRPKLVYFTELSIVSLSAIVAKLFMKFKIGFFTYAEEIQMDKDRPFHRWVFTRMIKSSNIIITVCDYTRNMLNEIYWADDKIVKIIPPVPFKKHSLQVDKERRDVVNIITVGRLEKRKGHLDVLESLNKLKEESVLFEYHIIGDGPYRTEIESKIKELKLESCVKMLGKISDDELEREYQWADIFVMPHKQLSDGDTEGCPTVFLEASYHYIPVIGGCAGGVSDAIINGETGYICLPNNSDLYANLRDLSCDYEKRIVMGKKGHNYSKEFTAENQALLFRNITTRYL